MDKRQRSSYKNYFKTNVPYEHIPKTSKWRLKMNCEDEPMPHVPPNDETVPSGCQVIVTDDSCNENCVQNSDDENM